MATPDKQLKIQIVTGFDDKGTKDAKKELEKVAKTIGSSNTGDSITANFKSAEKAAKDATKATKEMAAEASKAAKAAKDADGVTNTPAAEASRSAKRQRDLRAEIDGHKELGQAAAKSSSDVKQSGQGLLQAAYFIDDMQYGVKGILNNIPGLVMGLGMGGGVAGTLSIAAIAGSQLYDYLKGSKDEAKSLAENLNIVGNSALKGTQNRVSRGQAKNQAAFEIDQATSQPNTAQRAADDETFRIRENQKLTLIDLTAVESELTGKVANLQTAAATEEAKINQAKKTAVDTATRDYARQKQRSDEAIAAEKKKFDLVVANYMVAQQEQIRLTEEIKAQEAEIARVERLRDKAKEVGPGEMSLPGEYSEGRMVYRPTQDAIAASQELENIDETGIKNSLKENGAALNKAVAIVKEFVDSQKDNAGTMLTAATEFSTVVTTNSQTLGAANTKLGNAIQTANDEAITAKAALIQSVEQQIIPKLKEVSQLAEGQGGRVGAAVDQIKSYYEDNKLTTDELALIPAKLNTIQANFRGNKAQLADATEGLIGVVNDERIRVNSLVLAVNQLKAQQQMAPVPFR